MRRTPKLKPAGAPFVANDGIILIEVRTTTNTDFLSGEGPSRMVNVRPKAPFVIGSGLGYDGPAVRIEHG
jgi:hypothetical protein